MGYDIPILFVVFKRPDTTKRVFEEIARIMPHKLYIAADGYRKDVLGEEELCSEVRNIVSNIKWECEVKFLFRDENLGSALNVTKAISWIFEYEERCIILEDDTLPNESFWYFMNEMLERYKDEKSIMQINGLCPYKNIENYTESYTFSNILYHCWGWGTWKRAWAAFDFSMENFENDKVKNNLTKIIKNPFLRYLYVRNFVKHKFYFPKSWDGRWVGSCLAEFGIAIVPMVNMVVNLGLNHQFASHTVEGEHAFSKLKLENIKIPLIHPKIILINNQFEENGLRSFFGISLFKILNVALKKPYKELFIFVNYIKKNLLRLR